MLKIKLSKSIKIFFYNFHSRMSNNVWNINLILQVFNKNGLKIKKTAHCDAGPSTSLPKKYKNISATCLATLNPFLLSMQGGHFGPVCANIVAGNGNGPSEALPITSRRVNKLSQQFGRQKVCKARVWRYEEVRGIPSRGRTTMEHNSLVMEPK